MIIYLLNLLMASAFLVIMFIPLRHLVLLQNLSLWFSSAVFLTTLSFLWMPLDYALLWDHHHLVLIQWPACNISWSLAVDNLSLFYLILTSFLFFLLFLTARSLTYRVKEVFLVLWILEFLLLNCFMSLDMVVFYILFEALLLPMFLVIGVWGSQKEKIFAAYQFFLYTLVGSFFLLVSLLILLLLRGSTHILFLRGFLWEEPWDQLLFLCFLVSFAVKIPMFPFHLWLPKAHVEAPTVGSVLLAGVLLKLGSFGLLRYSLFLFPLASLQDSAFLVTFSSLAVFLSSFATLRQIDLKRLIAYSSIAHMNFLTGGLFLFNLYGLSGSLLLQMAHGLSSSALFLCIGFLYERYRTRNLFYYGSLITFMPFLSIFFFLFSLANLGFPGTVNFMAEMLLFLGYFESFLPAALILLVGIFLAAIYSFLTLSRLCFGPHSHFLRSYGDLSRRETLILLPLALLIVGLGFYPNLLVSYWVFFLQHWFLDCGVL